MDNSAIWKIIDTYFNDNPQSLVRHHIESYNDFFKNGIFKIFKEKNPLKITRNFDKTINDYKNQCIMYFGGKDGSKIYFGKPVIYDENDAHYMFPNEARLRNMNYGMTIHYDIDIEFIDILEPNEAPQLVGLENIQNGGYNDILTDSDDDDYVTLKNNIKQGKHIDELKRKEQGMTDEKITEERQKRRLESEKKLLEGGAPIQRKRRPTKGLDATPSETATIREATAKTMIGPNKQKITMTLEKIYLGKFPVMLQSNYCVLSTLPYYCIYRRSVAEHILLMIFFILINDYY
jgi:DNA-directed RNA polymerase beta subunit